MLVGKNKPVSYFSLNKTNGGSLRTKDSDGNEQFFDFIQGVLVGVELREDEYEGRKTNKYYFKFEPDDHGQIGYLQIGEDASAARGLLAALLTVPGEKIYQVRVRPYTSTDIYEGDQVTFVNVDVSVRQNSNQVWTRLIDVEEAKPMYTKIFKNMPSDQFERRDYIRRMAGEVKNRLTFTETSAGETVNEQTGEVHDGTTAADDLYNDEPSPTGQKRPAPHKQVEKEIHDEKSTMEWAKDRDDLPF